VFYYNMVYIIKNLINSFLEKFGYVVKKKNNEMKIPHHMHGGFVEIHKKTSAYTKTDVEEMYSAYSIVRYVISSKISGSIVECGVAGGGMMMLIAYTLLSNNSKERDLYLYDTFNGMPEPSERDVYIKNKRSAHSIWESAQEFDHNRWCYASYEDVKNRMESTNYPKEKIILVKGLVEETIPKFSPKSIAVLRLDTDFYESTKHELNHLFPRLSDGGVLIIDDYGVFQGARDAVDEYVKEHDIKIFLTRSGNGGGVLGVKNYL